MSAYSTLLATLVSQVEAAAITTPAGPLVVTSDPVRLIAGKPALVLFVQEIDYETMCMEGSPTVNGLLVGVAVDPGMVDLLEIVDAVAGLIGASQATRATWTPPGADPLPCLQLT